MMKWLPVALLLVAGCIDHPESEPRPAPAPAPPRKETPPPEPEPSRPPPVKKQKEPPPPPPEKQEAPPPPRAPEAPKDPGFKFDALKGDKLQFQSAEPTSGVKLEHGLLAFACLEKDFEARVKELLEKKGSGDPPALRATDEAVLYVLWGRRIGSPSPEAVIERKSGRIAVTARWKGPGMMQEARKAPYAGCGFSLGRLEPGEYVVGIWEFTPVDKDGPRLMKSIKFKVE